MPISSTVEAIKPALYGFESMLVPDTLNSLCYEWLDDYHKYSFTISPQVLPLLFSLSASSSAGCELSCPEAR